MTLPKRLAALPVRLHLEILEDRVLLSTASGQQAVSAVFGDVLHLRDDWDTSSLALVNVAQTAQNSTALSASLESWRLKTWSVLTTDLSQARQDFLQLEDAALHLYLRGVGTLLDDFGIHVPGLSPIPEAPVANNSDAGHTSGHGVIVSSLQGPRIGDPPISATEGTEWNGQVATITDSDGDDQNNYGQTETISGTINWGDSSSSPFNATVSEGQTANVFSGHMWMETGTYTVTVTASDPDGGQSQASETATVTDGALSWQENSPNEWGQQFHTVPTITTPTNQTNTEGDHVALQIHASDTDGDTVSYDALDLPPGLSINNSTGLISGTVAYGGNGDFGGVYNPTIIVADGQDGSAQASFSWTINQAQVAPVLTAPTAQTNLRGDTVSLQLNATQVDNDPISYDATNLPTGLSIDPDTGVISGTVDPSVTLGVPYAMTVTATDNVTNLSASQTFNWTINATNIAPVLTNPGNQTNSAGDDVSLQLLSATDADGDALTYTATGLPPGLTLDPIAGSISGTLPNSAASSTPYSVTVTASDGSASSSQSFTWTVNAVGLQNPGDQSNLDGDSVSLQLTASDANNASISYSATNLPPGLTIGSSTGLISGTLSSTADSKSPYSVTVKATDSNNNSVSQSFNWTVARVSLNPVNDQENQEGTSVSLQLSATDNEATPTYSATGLPPGLSISSSGLISGTVGIGSYGSSPYQVTVTATDGSARSSQSFVWTVTPRVALVNPSPQSNATGDSVSLQLSATSPGGTMTYSATGLPPGLSINSTTGLISGSPTTANSTPYTVKVTANDGTSSSSQTFAWTISVINLVSPGDQTNNDGDTVSLSLTKSYHGSGTLSYSATGLPTGLSISSTTGQITGTISGTADTDSPSSVTVTATDGTNTSSQTFNWTVDAVVSVGSISNQSNAVGDSVSLPVSASDSESKTLTYSATGLPSGLTISSGSGVISGTIALGADTSSPYTVSVTATDSSGNSATQSFTWTVAHVSLVNPGPQTSLDGAHVSLQLQGHDTDGNTVSYSASGLPSGLSVNGISGLISGTIASNADANSPYTVTVTASDGTNKTTQTFLWTVTQVSLTAPSNQTNTEGDTVSLQLQGVKSSGSLTYGASGLPAGLSLNTSTGLITGTIAAGAAADGPYTVDVSATNGTVSTCQTFTWTVNPIVNPAQPSDQSNIEGNSVSLQISATDSLGKSLTYTATGLPSGLSISSSGLISGTISSGDSANSPYAVTVTASDGTYSSSVYFNWTVTHTDTTALKMTNPGTQVYVTGDSVNLQINASDPDGIDTLIYSVTGLPDGLYFDPLSGLIAGTVADDAASITPYQVTVAADDDNGQRVSQTFAMLVNPSPLMATASPFSAVEGTDTGIITVASFTTADLNSQQGDFMVTINFGDGSTDFGTVSGGNGSFTVTDDHTYVEKGSYPVSIVITDDVTGASATATTTATVADVALTVTGAFQLGDAWDNQPSSFTLAEFTDANLDAPITDYTATINWGDGTPIQSGSGYVQETPEGDFLVVASHTYPDPWVPPSPNPATYTVSVTVTDVDGASATTTDTIVVGDIQAEKPAGMDWSFNDANPYATASDFVANGQTGMALVNWGDGTSNTVAITGGPGNGNGFVSFAIQASHIYADSMDQPGQNYKVTVTATDVDGNTLTGTEYVSVVRPPLALDTGNVAMLLNSLTLSNVQVAAFTVPDGVDTSSEFSAQINWGDNTSSAGTIQEMGPGLFAIVGSHTYSSYSVGGISITVSQGWSQQKPVAAGNAGGADAGQITLDPEIIKDPDTPKGMVPRIPPGKWVGPFKVTVGNGFRGQQIWLEVDTLSHTKKDGFVWLPMFPQAGGVVRTNAIELPGPGTWDYYIRATSDDQTEPGTLGRSNAGHIFINVTNGFRGRVLKQTDGFSVAAIPILVSMGEPEKAEGTQIPPPNGPYLWGAIYQYTVTSDSGSLPDLNEVKMSEKVIYQAGATGIFAGIANQPIDWWTPKVRQDLNGYAINGVNVSVAASRLREKIDEAKKNSKAVGQQSFIFSDARTGVPANADGSEAITVTKSGFEITEEAFKTKKGNYYIFVTRAATAENGAQPGKNASDETVPANIE